MGSIIETIQKKRFLPSMPFKDDLPISQTSLNTDRNHVGIRKRIASFSVNIQPTVTASSAWAFRKSRSMPSLRDLAGGPLRRWWERSWGWLLAKKPAFARDIEMNEEEIAVLGGDSKGSLRHVFYKVRSEIRKLVRSETLPTTHKFRYDTCGYA